MGAGGLEREPEAISMKARAFRGRKDTESVALVRQIDARCAQLRERTKEWGDVGQRGSQ